MARTLLALGSNLGDRAAILRRACHQIAELPDSRLLARSQWHETTPVGGPVGQSAFLNGALLVDSSLEPPVLAAALHMIEESLGRSRVVRWDARPIDIDLLLYDSLVVDDPQLTIPHPRMSFRRFVLEPAAEIAGSMWHPTARWTVSRLARHLRAAPPSALVLAANDAIASWLAARICQTLGATNGDFDSTGGLALAGGVQSKASGFGVRMIRFDASAFDASVSSRQSIGRPALIIAADPGDPAQLGEAIALDPAMHREKEKKIPRKVFRDFLRQNCDGPLARINSGDPATVVSEAVAAVCSVWPELAAESG